MLCDVMHAVAHFRSRIRNVLRVQSLVDWFPRRACVVTAKRTSSGNRNEDAVAIRSVQDDRVQTHAAGAGLPLRSRAVTAQSGKFLPRLAAVGRAKQRGIFDTGIDRVRIVE